MYAIRSYYEDLGFEYFSASDKKEFDEIYKRFITPEITKRPILFEIFTEEANESNALKMIVNTSETFQGKAKDVTKRLLGEKNINTLKRIIKS